MTPGKTLRPKQEKPCTGPVLPTAPVLLCLGKKYIGPGVCAQQMCIQPFLEQVS